MSPNVASVSLLLLLLSMKMIMISRYWCVSKTNTCEVCTQAACLVYWGNVKVIAATNRADTLDPALMRSGRLDRKIEFPHPTEDARARIIQVGAPSYIAYALVLGKCKGFQGFLPVTKMWSSGV